MTDTAQAQGPPAGQTPAGGRPDYAYLKAVFAALRVELGVEVEREPAKLPYVPTEQEIRRYYQAVWEARRSGDVVLIKTLLYTGVRVAELVAIRLHEVDLNAARIRITNGKGAKDRTCRSQPASAKPSPCTSTPAANRRGAPV